MGFFSRTFPHTSRVIDIINVLVMYGMGDLLYHLKITETFPFVRKFLPKRGKKSIDQFTRPEELRLALEELGPTFVKLGQMLSNRPDIIPVKFVNELEKLQDRVPPFTGEEAVGIVEAELEQPIKKIYKHFNKKPMASASIGQVHQAELYDGTQVAVKVQRPNIEKVISMDIDILYALASLAEKNSEFFRTFNPVQLVKEFESGIKKELDYNLERLNLERFCQSFKDDDRIFIPRDYKDFSCKRVYTMELVEGIKISRITDEDLPGYDRELIATNGANLMLKQIFVDGFFHADPHSGNIMVLEDNRICFIDFGMMGSLLPSQREELSNLILSLVYKDTALITNAILTVTKRPNHPRLHEIESSVQDLVDRYLEVPLEDLNIAEVLQSLINLIETFKLRIPNNMTLMVKALITIEGVGLQLYPQFQLYKILEDFSLTIIQSKFNARRLLTAALLGIMEVKRLVEHAPSDISSIIKKVKEGKLKIEFEHYGLGSLQSSLDTLANRFVVGVTLGSLIIGSSIMVHADIAPKWNDIPIIGLIGFVSSGILACLILIASVVRHFRRK